MAGALREGRGRELAQLGAAPVSFVARIVRLQTTDSSLGDY
jgi:hypothetical protein